jgi:hypothetical protein
MAKKKRSGKTKSLPGGEDTREREEDEPQAPTVEVPEEGDAIARLKARKATAREGTRRITTDLPDSRFTRWKKFLADLGIDGNTVANELIEDALKRGGY